MDKPASPPVCDYTDSDYQASFWEQGGREYEDRVEAIALKRLLPTNGSLLLELGAGAGRNTPRYAGFERVALVDYSITQLAQAQTRLGLSERYIYIAADAYRLPFLPGLFDGATMIRTLHHMSDAPRVLNQVRYAMQPGAVFILEFANKLNFKAILRYLIRRQSWNPFSMEPVEFAALNFDFHPRAVKQWLSDSGFLVEKTRTVSHFRVELLKRLIPAKILAGVDSMIQWTGDLWQLTPSVFVRAKATGQTVVSSQTKDISLWFKCLSCGHAPLTYEGDTLTCPACASKWAVRNGIYDFREPMQ